jgi:hypothetical protein
MKNYENYLFDEAEKLLNSAHRDLAEDKAGSGLSVYKGVTDTEANLYGKQYAAIDGIYNTICQLFEIKDIELCCAGSYIGFDVIISQIENKQTVTCSPILSREKLLSLKTNELAGVIIELFLDRENWSKELKYSTVLSDGNGNWIA